MGLYEEAAHAFEDAFRIQSNHQFMFNKAAALSRLRRYEEAEEVLQRAIDRASGASDEWSRNAVRKYRKQVHQFRRTKYPVMWWNWWFGDDDTFAWLKRIFGVFLLIVLLGYIIAPFFSVNTELLKQRGWLWWPSPSGGWQSYIVPIVAVLLILLSPMIRAIGPRVVELSPALMFPEIKLQDIVRELKPKLS
jgi:tetratricopeptide (TPR) repeat protein